MRHLHGRDHDAEAAIATTATSSDQRVERSDHSFVHSELITRSCVTLPIAMRRGAGA